MTDEGTKRLNKHFKENYLNTRVLLKGGFSGTLINWKEGNSGNLTFSSYQVKIKQTVYKVHVDNIVAWELEKCK